MIVPDSHRNRDGGHFEAQIQDLEDPIPAAQPVLHNGIRPMLNGGPGNIITNGIVPPSIQNGLIGDYQNFKKVANTRPSTDTIRDMYADVEGYQ